MNFLLQFTDHVNIILVPKRYMTANLATLEICPEMHANEMHELYDRHHKVSPNLGLTKTQIIMSDMKS